MPFKDKEDRRRYMQDYRMKKKLEQEQIALREKNIISDLNFKKLSGKITQVELAELQRLEAKYYPKETEVEPVDPWGELFLTDEDRELNKDPPKPEDHPDPEISPGPSNVEFEGSLIYGRDSGKTIYLDPLTGEPVKKPKRKKGAWGNFWPEDP